MLLLEYRIPEGFARARLRRYIFFIVVLSLKVGLLVSKESDFRRRRRKKTTPSQSKKNQKNRSQQRLHLQCSFVNGDCRECRKPSCYATCRSQETAPKEDEKSKVGTAALLLTLSDRENFLQLSFADQEEEAKLEEQRKAEEAERERKKLKAGIPNPRGSTVETGKCWRLHRRMETWCCFLDAQHMKAGYFMIF